MRKIQSCMSSINLSGLNHWMVGALLGLCLITFCASAQAPSTGTLASYHASARGTHPAIYRAQDSTQELAYNPFAGLWSWITDAISSHSDKCAACGPNAS